MSATTHRRVAVVGAGISGVCTAAHLLRCGLSVTVLERSSMAGGVWHFDPESAHDPEYPNTRPSKGDFKRYKPGQGTYLTPPGTPDSDSEGTIARNQMSISGMIRRSHAPPGPCYSSLKNNVPLTLMKTSLLDWPSGLDEYVSQRHLEQYIQKVSRDTGVERVTEYNTRVELMVKRGNVWRVTTAVMYHGFSGVSHVATQTRDFDAVVVASGHYHMPRVPDIPGLKQWKEQYPSRIRHSKTYRSAEGLENKRVLLIGSGVSSCDIAKDLALVNTETYQSSRGGNLELPTTFLPENVVRIGPVKSFTRDQPNTPHPLQTPTDPLPGHITLQNGTRLCGIHQVILATGYITSYPFLPQLHSDDHPRTRAGDRLLVTKEGDMVHNLHKDIFYIEDPTLSFVGVPYHIATFSLFEFQAQIVARVLSGHLELPSKYAMREEYNTRVERKGLGRDFHSLRDLGEEPRYVADLVEWANRDAARLGAQVMLGHTEEWHRAYIAHKERVKFLVGSRRRVPDARRYDDVELPGTVSC